MRSVRPFLAFVSALLLLSACDAPTAAERLPRGIFRGSLSGDVAAEVEGTARSDSVFRRNDIIYLADTTAAGGMGITLQYVGGVFREGSFPVQGDFDNITENPGVYALAFFFPQPGGSVLFSQSGTITIEDVSSSGITGSIDLTLTARSASSPLPRQVTLRADFKTSPLPR